MPPLITFTEKGLYCPRADVYIDPWRPVNKAVITHAHADHSRPGMKHYLAHRDSVPVMKHRLGPYIDVQGIPYDHKVQLNGVDISLHPAGHIIGSAQVRVAYKGEVWVISGDYKIQDDGVCTPFEPVKCTHFVTESTFGLPVYHWRPQAEVMADLNAWWQENAAAGRATLISAYSLGKAQRILQHLNPEIGPIFAHPAVENTHAALRAHGISLRPSPRVVAQGAGKQSRKDFEGALVIVPPAAIGSAWAKRFPDLRVGIASGWMQLRGTRRRRAADRGFVLSDHADWPGLQYAIKETGAEHIYVTHGYTDIFSRWLREQGYDAHIVQTEFDSEEGNGVLEETSANSEVNPT
ncbi:MAG: ligase-associated DNA damage response exonuclease [Bacteroidota bacterium]